MHLKSKAAESNSLEYATYDDPVMYLDGGKLYVLPAPNEAVVSSYAHIYILSYPTVGYDFTEETDPISKFPGGIIDLIVLYAVIQVYYREMSYYHSLSLDEIQAITNTGILDAVDTALDAAKTAFGKIATQLTLGETDSEGDVNTALSALTTKTSAAANAVAAIYTEVSKIDDDIDTASTSISTNEDIELGQAELGVAQSRIANVTSLINYMQSNLTSAEGFAKEVQTRLLQAGAKREEAASRAAEGMAYLQEAQARLAKAATRLQIAQSYDNKSNLAAQQIQVYEKKYERDIAVLAK